MDKHDRWIDRTFLIAATLMVLFAIAGIAILAGLAGKIWGLL